MCSLCFNSQKENTIPLKCGHYVHASCLRASLNVWECPECGSAIGSAQYDGGDWFVGIHSPDGMHCCYKIDSESKLIPFHKRKPTWYRANGRLTRCDTVSLAKNISIF